jgi:hypothetical protein
MSNPQTPSKFVKICDIPLHKRQVVIFSTLVILALILIESNRLVGYFYKKLSQFLSSNETFDIDRDSLSEDVLDLWKIVLV